MISHSSNMICEELNSDDYKSIAKAVLAGALAVSVAKKLLNKNRIAKKYGKSGSQIRPDLDTVVGATVDSISAMKQFKKS